MADASAQAEIRGIDIDKLAKGFADEDIIFKKHCQVSTTKSRHIRWYQKTAGIRDSPDTTGITKSKILTSSKSRPVVVEQSWTRDNSYVKKFFVESPWLSEEDIKDTDIDILATNIRDLTRAVAKQVDARIWDVMTEGQTVTNINGFAITNEWDDTTNGTVVNDLLSGAAEIRIDGYDPNGATLFINSQTHKDLLVYFISTKGSSIPAFSSEKVKSGVVMSVLGFNVVVSEHVTSDYAAIVIPKVAVTWKSFTPLRAFTITDEGIGTKIRVLERGEALLTDPKAVCLISNVGPS